MIVIFWTKFSKKGSHFLSKTEKIDITIEFCICEVVFVSIKFYFEQTILNYWTKFAQERYLWSKTEKVNIIIEFHLLKLVLVPNFNLNRQFWFFWPDLPKKSFSALKQKKWTQHIFNITLHIQINLVQNFSFSSNWQFLFFGSSFHKEVILVKNWKSKHHHWILHIQISLLIPNFCFNWQFLFFWPDLSKKVFSDLKQEKWTLHIS